MTQSTKTKKITGSTLLLGVLTLVAGCEQPADVASRNISKAADNFEVSRRVVFYNGITDTYLLSIEGLCSIGNAGDVFRRTDRLREREYVLLPCRVPSTDHHP